MYGGAPFGSRGYGDTPASPVIPIVKVIDETVALVETPEFVLGLAKVIDETVALLENVLKSIAITKIVDEDVAIVETTANIKGFVRAINEALSITEAAERARDFLDDLSTTFYWHAEYGIAPVKGGEPTFDRGSSAWAIDQRGTWVEYLTDTLRFTWRIVDSMFSQVVAKTELTATNKCQRNVDYGANGTTGWSLAGNGQADATLVVADDTEELRKAGLHLLVSDGQVLKIDNSAASAATLAVASGATGNANTHAVSVFWRGGGPARIQTNQALGPLVQLPEKYGRASAAITPSGSSDKLAVRAEAGAVVYFVLPQLEENPFPTSPIRNPSAGSVTRDGDTLTYEDAPDPRPPYALYVRWIQGFDSPTGQFTHVLTINTGATADPRFELRENPDGDIEVTVRDVDGDRRVVPITPSPLLDAGNTVEALYFTDPDGTGDFILKVEGRSVQHVSHVAPVSGLPEFWGTKPGEGKISLNQFPNGAGPGKSEPATLKMFKRGHLNETHIDASDWTSLMDQARQLVLGPGGNLRGPVSR